MLKIFRNKTRISLLLLGAAAAALSSYAFLPTEVDATQCQCLPEDSTPIVTGVSTADCAWAEMDAKNQAFDLIACTEGTCSQRFEVIDDNSCNKFWPEGEFRVTGRYHYQCEVCLPGM